MTSIGLASSNKLSSIYVEKGSFAEQYCTDSTSLFAKVKYYTPEGQKTTSGNSSTGNPSTTVKRTDTAATTKPSTAATTKSTATTKSDGKVSAVSINSAPMSVNQGASGTLTASIYPHDANNTNVTWKSGNQLCVAMYSDGRWEALRPGQATITVTTRDGVYTDSIVITVY